MAHTAAHLNAESFWWRQCSEQVLNIKIPDPPTSPSLITLNGFCGRKAPCFLPSASSVPRLALPAQLRKHEALRPQKPLRLIRDGEVGGSGILYLTPTRYTVTTRMILH